MGMSQSKSGSDVSRILMEVNNLIRGFQAPGRPGTNSSRSWRAEEAARLERLYDRRRALALAGENQRPALEPVVHVSVEQLKARASQARPCSIEGLLA
jgi:hypothetical protein